jgi:two-component system NtrC family sensor kinase
MRRSRISVKLIFAVGSVSAFAIGAFSYFLLRTHQRELLVQVKQSANQLSETIKSSTRYAMLLNHREHLHQMIDSIGSQESIDKARIFNKDGRVIYSSDQEEMGKMVNKQAEACYACHAADRPLERLAISERSRIFDRGEGKSLGLINPIYNEPSCWQAPCHAHDSQRKVLGVLDVTIPLDEVERDLAAARFRVVIFAVTLIAVVSFILWVLVRKLVGDPVAQLVEATNTVAEGDLGHKIEVNTHDELGNLSRSFNAMTVKLADAQRQIHHQDKLASLGRLAAGVAHEINNPLTGVLTYSSYLLKRAGDDPKSREDLEVIVRETKRCREIVKGLLDFAREIPAKKVRLNVNTIMEEVLQIVESQLGLNNIEVAKDLDPALGEIVADAGQIRQVFMNLVVNAIDAMNESGGTLSLRTFSHVRNGRHEVVVRVADTGKGISRAESSKIFEPFYSTKGAKGTGLGLAIAWGIVEILEGNIEVQPEEGRGAVFLVYLPMYAEV